MVTRLGIREPVNRADMFAHVDRYPFRILMTHGQAKIVTWQHVQYPIPPLFQGPGSRHAPHPARLHHNHARRMRVGKFLGNDRAADDDFNVGGSCPEICRDEHGVPGRGEQSAETDDLRSALDRLIELRNIDIDAEVVDGKTSAFEHHDHEILADVMQVAFH